jgi:hypothetical protein
MDHVTIHIDDLVVDGGDITSSAVAALRGHQAAASLDEQTILATASTVADTVAGELRRSGRT